MLNKTVLNENINEFDNREKRIGRIKKRTHSLKKWIKRIFYVMDAKLFETTYKDEYQKQNVLIDKQTLRLSKLQKDNDRAMRKIKRLEKRVKKHEK